MNIDKEIRLFIFDLDGTFYDISDLIAYNFRQETAFLMKKLNIEKEEAEKQLKENGIYPEVRDDAKSCSEYFGRLGLDLSEWNRIRTLDFPAHLINRNNAVSQETIGIYKEKGIVTLVSNNTMENIQKVFDHLGIDKGSFEDIVSKETQGLTSADKTDAYRRIMEKHHIRPSEVLAIGDRYNIDVLPVLRLNGRGAVVSGPKGVKDLIEENGEESSGNNSYRIISEML